MEVINKKNLTTAKNEAINSLNKYLESKEEKYLNKAFDLDNTNPKILYYYLENKKKDQKVYDIYYKKHKFFLNEKFSSKLNEQYIDHKKDVIAILNSVKDKKIKPTNIDSLVDCLTACYPREDMLNFGFNSQVKENNMPFNIDDEHMYFLSLKTSLGAKLYNIIDNKLDEKDKNENKKEVFQESLCYLKILSKIFIYFIENNEKHLLYNIISFINFNDKQNANTDTRLQYYLNLMKEDFNKIYEETGYNIFKYKVEIITNFIDEEVNKLKNLYFELMEKILKSKCIKDVLNKIKEIQKDDNFNKIDINEDFVKYLKNNTIFFRCFDEFEYGMTNVRELKTIINIDFRKTILEFKYTLLFNFCIWIITGLHEYIGHLLKQYYYYSSNFIISNESPKIKIIKNIQKKEKVEKEKEKEKNESGNLKEKEEKENDKSKIDEEEKDEEEEEKDEEEEEDEEEYEEGFQVEKLLFGELEHIYFCDIMYILNIKNWEKNLNEFTAFFTSKKRRKKIKKKNPEYKIDDECKIILSHFGIFENELSSIRSDASLKFRKEKLGQISMALPVKCATHKNYH